MKPSRLLLGAHVGAHVALAGCGGDGEPGRLVTETVGTGPQTATIVRPAGDERRPVVLFLHGWGATRPRFDRPWIDHLARAGNAVIYPRYQDSVVDPPAEVLGNVLAGVRQAFARIAAKPRTLVVAGHSVTRRSGTGCGEVRRRSCPSVVVVFLFRSVPRWPSIGYRMGHRHPMYLSQETGSQCYRGFRPVRDEVTIIRSSSPRTRRQRDKRRRR